MKKALFVSGVWDENGGRASSYMQKFAKELSFFYDLDYYNGGNFTDLSKYCINLKTEVIFWFADVPNEYPKVAASVKSSCPTSILVTSKRNDNKKYSDLELISRALANKANLLLELKKEDGIIFGRLIDPLGNVFLDFTKDINEIARIMASRIYELSRFTRVNSEIVDQKIEVPENELFFKQVMKLGDTFHELIHPVNTERFLGNCSFRCENGFPSFRGLNNIIYVSERNIDKRGIKKENFVPVFLDKSENLKYCFPKDANVFEYKKKPSVDAPIQKLLYQYYENINYMIHAHVNVEGGIMTSSTIPCGAIEEFYEIIKYVPKDTEFFKLNLQGHGCLVGSKICEKDTFTKLTFTRR